MSQGGYGLLQVPLTNVGLVFRLAVTKPYSDLYSDGTTLLNCANLVLVVLDLVTDTREYLEKCKARARETQFHELDTITREAFQAVGIAYDGAINHMKTIPNDKFIFTSNLNKIGESLKNEYATPLGLRFSDGAQHLVILRKHDDGSLEFLDPQALNKDGSYPLRFKVGDIFNENPYKNDITDLFQFEGPVLSKEKSFHAKSAYGKNIMNERRGGKRKGGKQTKRRSKKRGLKSVRRKTIRGSSLYK